MNRRIDFFDTTKGLLMLFLIWGHLIVFSDRFGIKTDFFPVIQYSTPLYRVYFIQTFFFITGFCTSWNISFSTFVVKNIKTLILPTFVFLPFAWLTDVFTGTELSASSFVTTLKDYCTGHMPWFISSLFISKVLFWIINHLSKRVFFDFLILGVLFVIGLVIKESTSIPNCFYYQNALVMLPFMALGFLVKRIENCEVKCPFAFIKKWGGLFSARSLALLSSPYFMIIALWQVLGLKFGFPAVDYYVSIDYKTAPFYLVFAISGTALIFLIAKQMIKSRFLSLLGRQSLFIYLIHWFVVCGLMKIYINIFCVSSSFFSGFAFYVSIYLISLLLIWAGCRMVETKHFCWMISKY